MQGDRVARAYRSIRLRGDRPGAVVDREGSGTARNRHAVVELGRDVVVAVGRENPVLALAAVGTAATARSVRMGEPGNLHTDHAGVRTDSGARRAEPGE